MDPTVQAKAEETLRRFMATKGLDKISDAQKCKALLIAASDPRVQTLFRYDRSLQGGDWDGFLDTFDDVYCNKIVETLETKTIHLKAFLQYLTLVEPALIGAENLKEAIQCHIDDSKRYIDELVDKAIITELEGVLLMLKPIKSDAIRLFLSTELKFGSRAKISLSNFWNSALNGSWYTKNILGDGCNGPVVEKMVAIYATAPDNLPPEESAVWYQLQKALRRAYTMHTDKTSTNVDALKYLRPILKRAFVEEVIDRLDLPAIVSYFLCDYDRLYVPIAMEDVIVDTNSFLLEPSSAELKDIFERWMAQVMKSLSRQAPRLPKEEAFPLSKYVDKDGNAVAEVKQFDADKATESDLVKWLAFYEDVISDPETMTLGRLNEFLLGFSPISCELLRATTMSQRQQFSILFHMIPDVIFRAIGTEWYDKEAPIEERWHSLCRTTKEFFEGYIPLSLIQSKFMAYKLREPFVATCAFCGGIDHTADSCQGTFSASQSFPVDMDSVFNLVYTDGKRTRHHTPIAQLKEFHAMVTTETLKRTRAR